MKKLAILFFALFCCCLVSPGFFCPNDGPNSEYRRPNPPIIDSVCVGVNASGKEGAWIYFHPDLSDTLEGIASFKAFRRTSNDSGSVYVLLLQDIPPRVRKFFDGEIKFFSSDLWRPFPYYYKMVAQDSSLPPGISDTSTQESLYVCKQADLIYPADDTTLQSIGKFRFQLRSFEAGCEAFIGVNCGDSTYWSQQACLPTNVCYFLIQNFRWEDFSHIGYNSDGSATVTSLQPGSYFWWVKVYYGIYSQSIKAEKFTIE